MDLTEFKRMMSDVETENSLFSNKAKLDTLTVPSQIVERREKIMELLRIFLGYRKGLVVPYVSVYGRSGSGKSTIVRYVCENLDDASFCFVNLRRARTVFGCANLILAGLGRPNIKSPQGINLAIDEIERAIVELFENSGKNFLVLVLDEIDSLFGDKRGSPSDFIYKLITLEEKLRMKNCQMCIVGISNNVMSEYDIDERVRSRIGSTEVFFEAYSKKEVLEILKDRASDAFSKKIDDSVLEHCAKLSSSDHGDARRAIDLLRVGAEIASKRKEKITTSHIDAASEQIQIDRVRQILSGGSYHFKLASCAVARIAFLSGLDWHATSDIYRQYTMIISKDERPLTYRRVSELLVDLANSGICVSQTGSRGRGGYGTRYRLLASPAMIGNACFPTWWKEIEDKKRRHDLSVRHHESERRMFRGKRRSLGGLTDMFDDLQKRNWSEYAGF